MARGPSFRLLNGKRVIREMTNRSSLVRQTVDEEIRQMAEEIKEGSMQRAPEKTGDLVDSHKVTERSVGGRTHFDVGFGPVENEGRDYGLIMHEGLEGIYNLGPISAAKNTTTPHRGHGVGMKFLKRSFDAVTRRARERLKLAAESVIEKGL